MAMSPVSSFLYLLPLTLCLTLHPRLIVGVENNGTDLIAKACSNSPGKDFCISVLNSEPNSQKADLKGLAFIALKAAAKNATDTLVHIKQWLNDKDVEPAVGDSLSSCEEAYLDVVDQIDDSVEALVSDALGDVETWVKVAIADIDTCEGGVKGLTGYALELSRKNHVLRHLCNNALSIVHVSAGN